MTLIPNRAGSLLALLLVLLAPSAIAATGLPDETARAMDRRVRDIKQESISLMREMAVAEARIRCPMHSCAHVYTTVRVSGFLLDEIEISVDGAPGVGHAYDASESRALLKGGYHQVLRLNLDPGAHTLRTTILGHFADAGVDEPPIRETIEQTIYKGFDELHVVQAVDRGGRRRSARLEPPLVLRSQSAYAPAEQDAARNPQVLRYEDGSAADPRVRVARFFHHDGRYLSALIELDAALSARPDGDSGDESVNRLRAEAMINFGLIDDAENLLERIAPGSTDPRRLAELELSLAELMLERGLLERAERLLGRVRSRLPPDGLAPWREISARLLLAQGRYAEAIPVLDALAEDAPRAPYTRYNLGIALLNDGREGRGREVLDSVGRMAVYDNAELALRDKANVVLGFHFLKQELGGTAKPLFERVRVEGPHSNRALLGLGWAELAPRGERQRRTDGDDDSQSTRTPYSSFSNLGVLIRPGYFDASTLARLGLTSFKLDTERTDEERRYLRALVPWSELAKRDPFEQAVQEGRLAIPYALDRIGAHQQALQHYLQAIAQFEAARKAIDEGIAAIPGGRMMETLVRRDVDAESGWKWDLTELAKVPETYWLADLIAEHRYQEALKNYRDIRVLARRLDAMQAEARRVPAELALRRSGAWPLELTLSQLRSRYEPPAGRPLSLKLENWLGGAWFGAGPMTLRAPGPRRLRLAGPPPRFDGPIETLERLQPRVASLRAVIAQAGADQRALLDRMAIDELQKQKKLLERYLLEARFAVARIYDRQLKDQP